MQSGSSSPPSPVQGPWTKTVQAGALSSTSCSASQVPNCQCVAGPSVLARPQALLDSDSSEHLSSTELSRGSWSGCQLHCSPSLNFSKSPSVPVLFIYLGRVKCD